MNYSPPRLLGKRIGLFAMSIVAAATLGIGISLGQSEFFQSLGVGARVSSLGEQLRVGGRAIFGESGKRAGGITLMPPDGTGWYSIDNPGGQQLRISSGWPTDQYVYMTISHPGRVKIYGSLQVTGAITDASGQPYAMGVRGHGMGPVPPYGGGGKADSVEALQDQVDELRMQLNAVIERINKLQ